MLRCALVITVTPAALAGPALAAETYVFDRKHSDIRFGRDHFGSSTTSAEFEASSGAREYTPGDVTASSVDITIDPASVDSGFETFNGHLRNKEEWFNTAEHSRATFASTGLEKLGDQRYAVTGDLALKGVAREVTLDAAINRIGKHPVSKAKTTGFDAYTTVSRSAFDTGKHAPSAGGAVTIRISSAMQRKSDRNE